MRQGKGMLVTSERVMHARPLVRWICVFLACWFQAVDVHLLLVCFYFLVFVMWVCSVFLHMRALFGQLCLLSLYQSKINVGAISCFILFCLYITSKRAHALRRRKNIICPYISTSMSQDIRRSRPLFEHRASSVSPLFILFLFLFGRSWAMHKNPLSPRLI